MVVGRKAHKRKQTKSTKPLEPFSGLGGGVSWMRWKSSPKLKEGDRITKEKFLFFPRLVGDKWVWLEWVKFHYQYCYVHLGYQGAHYYWNTEIEIDYDK